MSFDHPPLTIALAMLIGVLAQGVARHARIPGIVILLLLGVALGPDGANYVRPQILGKGLPAFVGFAVAIILFEGALNIRLGKLRKQAVSIRRLVTRGAFVTGVLATTISWLLMGWEWRLALLFGTLVMVTGPTVVNPLVRRLRLKPHLGEILLAEGIFVDAVGATIAVATLEIVLAETKRAAAGEMLSIFLRFGAGALIGLGAGLLLAGLLKVRRLVPSGLENVLALAFAVASFQVGDALVPESGLTAAIVAGLVVGNLPLPRLNQIAEFEEQLTDLLIATLFVLLAADVRMADVTALGWHGVAVVALLMLVVRPASVFVSTYKSELSNPDKLCLSWIAPRGIVAAAVASLFAREVTEAGLPGGSELRALVFVVIAATVTIQGLTAGLVARALGVRLPARKGTLILGANPLACLLAHTLIASGRRVHMIEAREDVCEAARAQGLEVVQGDGLSHETLREARIDEVESCIGMTPNEHVNFLFARLVSTEFRGPALFIMLERHDRGVTVAMADEHDISALFTGESTVRAWLERAGAGTVTLQRWRYQGSQRGKALEGLPLDEVLPVAVVRGGEVQLVHQRTTSRVGDELILAVGPAGCGRAAALLAVRKWHRLGDAALPGRLPTAPPEPNSSTSG